MRPNTSVSGIFNTKRSSPVSTNMLTKILVPKPKKAFQSPALHNLGRKSTAVVMCALPSSGSLHRYCCRRSQEFRRSGHRAENATLRLDHGEAGLMEFREIAGAAVRQH